MLFQFSLDSSVAWAVLVALVLFVAIRKDHKARFSARHGKSQIDLKTTPQIRAQDKKGKK